MQIFIVLQTIAIWCNASNFSPVECKKELIECVQPKEGAPINYKKITDCFKGK